jgi:RNA polymerase sigma factor for flagellar operon FliA
MFDRQFLTPLRAAAAVDGAVAPRPASRLFTEARASQVVEPLIKPPSALELELQPGPEHELGSAPEHEPGSGSEGGALPDDGDRRRGRPTRSRNGAAASSEQAIGIDDGTAAADLTAAADAILAADGVAAAEPAAAEPAAAEPVAGPETVPDLTGYGAYGNVPAAGLGMSRDELVSRYAHLVKYVVGRLGVSVPGLFDHEDAMQAGVLGLLRAIDAYKPEAAASFESYAILRIRGSILDAVRSLDTVGRAGREAARAIQGAIRDLQHELGRSPTESEIAARLGLPVARYRERLQAASVVTISLDEHDSRDSDDDSTMLADNAPDPNAVDPADEAARRDSIASLIQEIGRLGQRSRMVLALYYQDEMTFREIGQVLGVTESRVCQIHTEAILVLRGRLVDSDVAARLGRRRARR